jgi:hypothetical protein
MSKQSGASSVHEVLRIHRVNTASHQWRRQRGLNLRHAYEDARALTSSLHELWIGDSLPSPSEQGQVIFGAIDSTVKTFWVADERRGSHDHQIKSLHYARNSYSRGGIIQERFCEQ